MRLDEEQRASYTEIPQLLTSQLNKIIIVISNGWMNLYRGYGDKNDTWN
jgi:hypothetical protein